MHQRFYDYDVVQHRARAYKIADFFLLFREIMSVAEK
jgi:hypothetical protein